MESDRKVPEGTQRVDASDTATTRDKPFSDSDGSLRKRQRMSASASASPADVNEATALLPSESNQELSSAIPSTPPSKQDDADTPMADEADAGADSQRVHLPGTPGNQVTINLRNARDSSSDCQTTPETPPAPGHHDLAKEPLEEGKSNNVNSSEEPKEMPKSPRATSPSSEASSSSPRIELPSDDENHVEPILEIEALLPQGDYTKIDPSLSFPFTVDAPPIQTVSKLYDLIANSKFPRKTPVSVLNHCQEANVLQMSLSTRVFLIK